MMLVSIEGELRLANKFVKDLFYLIDILIKKLLYIL